MNTWHRDHRVTRIVRVRRVNPDTGAIRETRYYARKAAARARAAKWEERGWVAHIDYGGTSLRFQGARP